MKFISFEKSQELLQALHVEPAGWENICLTDALGRVLAEDITALHPSPEFATSAMDGYAILIADQDNGRIAIMGDNPAGSELTQEIRCGYCIKTFTGSKMPSGSDAIIPIEYVSVDGDAIVVNKKYNAGDILIKKGTKISFAEVGVLAGLNRVMIKVFTKPKVAVLSTGSEILDIGQESTTSTQIRSSNN